MNLSTAPPLRDFKPLCPLLLVALRRRRRRKRTVELLIRGRGLRPRRRPSSRRRPAFEGGEGKRGLLLGFRFFFFSVLFFLRFRALFGFSRVPPAALPDSLVVAVVGAAAGLFFLSSVDNTDGDDNCDDGGNRFRDPRLGGPLGQQAPLRPASPALGPRRHQPCRRRRTGGRALRAPPGPDAGGGRGGGRAEAPGARQDAGVGAGQAGRARGAVPEDAGPGDGRAGRALKFLMFSFRFLFHAFVKQTPRVFCL